MIRSCSSGFSIGMHRNNVVGTESIVEYVFFSRDFNRLKIDILNDLPTLYELPKEAIDWIAEQISYNVAGGKMNRGLATVAVHKTLANATGTPMTDKVTEPPYHA
jgi:hypothetical protein